MSDSLHRAVQNQLDSHEPGPTPPFEAILGRKKRRDRHRAGAAIAAAAVAVAGVAFVPSVLGTGSGEKAPNQIAQDPPVVAADERLPCAAPRMFIYGLARTTGGAPTAEEAADRFAARTDGDPGYAGQTWTRGETKTNGELQLYGQTARLGLIQGSDGTWFVISGSACPARAAAAEQYGFHVKATDTRTVLAAGQKSQDAIKSCMELPGVYNATVAFSAPGQWSGFIAGRDEAEGFKRCVGAVPDWEATVQASQEAPSAHLPNGGEGSGLALVDVKLTCDRLGERSASGTVRGEVVGLRSASPHEVNVVQGADAELGRVALPPADAPGAVTSEVSVERVQTEQPVRVTLRQSGVRSVSALLEVTPDTATCSKR